MELFLSVFLGILAGALIGAASLFILDIFSKFLKRKDLILNIASELIVNRSINNNIKNVINNVVSKDYESCISLFQDREFFNYSSIAFNNYFKDLNLIFDGELFAETIYVYSIINSITFNYRAKNYFLGKIRLKEINYYRKDYQDFLEDDFTKNYISIIKSQKFNENSIRKKLIELQNVTKQINVSEDDLKKSDTETLIKKAKDVLDKQNINYQETIASNEKIINNLIKLISWSTEEFDNKTKILIEKFKNANKINFFVFIKLLLTNYFKKT